MPDTTVAIIGAGIGGVYLAAELGMLGCKLRLHDLDDGRLAEIRTRGGIDVARVNFGPNTGFAATACGNSGDNRGNTAPMRLPGKVAICSQRFLTIGSMRAGPRRQQE